VEAISGWEIAGAFWVEPIEWDSAAEVRFATIKVAPRSTGLSLKVFHKSFVIIVLSLTPLLFTS
jgi:hypothetical protein